MSSFRILGLCLALTCTAILLQYLHFEHNFDQFHLNKAQLYRVESKFIKNNSVTDSWATSAPGYGPAMLSEFPEIETYTRINFSDSERIVRYKTQKFREKNVCWVDSSFFSVFTFDLLEGSKKNALHAPGTMAISASAAKRYFGDAAALGKTLTISNFSGTEKFEIRAVFKDMPANSSIQLDFMLSSLSAPKWMHQFWYLHEAYTYIVLKPGANPKNIEDQFPQMAEKYKTEAALKDKKWAIDLLPLEALHLSPLKEYAQEAKSDPALLQFLSIACILLLALAWFNESNITTSQALKRKKEALIRKVLGAEKKQLMLLVFFDSLLHQFCAFLLSLMFLQLASSLQLLPSLLQVHSMDIYLFTGAIAGVGVIVCSLIPIVAITSVQLKQGIKSSNEYSKKGKWFGQSVVVVQVALTLSIITLSYLSFAQLSYMQEKKKGVQTESILVVQSPKTDQSALPYLSFKNSIKQLPGVEDFTGSNAVPGMEIATFYANKRAEQPEEETKLYEMLKTDFNFIPFYGLQLVAGRGFDPDLSSDSSKVVLNRNAVAQFGFANVEEAVGQRVLLETSSDPKEIIGVVENYHQQSLHAGFKPIVMQHDPQLWWIPKKYYSIKINSAKTNNTLSSIHKIWKQYYPDTSFDHFYLSQFYTLQYQSDIRYKLYFSLFSFIGLCIAIMGVIGQTLLHTEHKRKEMSIRKIIGASVGQIAGKLYQWAFSLFGLGALLSIPLSLYFIELWLSQYAYPIPLSSTLFALPIIGFFAIVTLVIFKIVLNLAMVNPVVILKDQ